VLLAILLFGLLLAGLPALGLPPMGLLAAVAALALLAGWADTGLRWQQRLLLAALLVLGSYLVCILWLKMPLPLWPVWPAAPAGN
jgi:hypothetical protein